MDRIKLIETNLTLLARVQLQGPEAEPYMAVVNDLRNQHKELEKQVEKTADKAEPVSK